MDRNQIVGILVISAMMLGYMFYQNETAPKVQPLTEIVSSTEAPKADNLLLEETSTASATTDSSAKEATILVQENENFVLEFSNKGAIIKSVKLKDFKDYKKKDLYLFTPESNVYKYDLGKGLTSQSLTFEAPSVKAEGENTVVTFDNGKAIVIYTIPKKGYDIAVQITAVGNGGSYAFDWKQNLLRQEQGLQESLTKSGINYYSSEDGIERFGTGKGTDNEAVEKPQLWFAHTQRFFNAAIIADKGVQNLVFATTGFEGDTNKIKKCESKGAIAFEANTVKFRFYYGPNDYKITKKIAEGFDKNVNMGWGFFSWINKFLVVPVFKLLENVFSNYGLIILALVIIIKTALFPIAYKSYKAMATMKELKPELDAIRVRCGDDQAKFQQEQMKLYGEVGVNPLAGCIPVILQMPFLFALFNFFPNSIELRQQSFLWAHDLSTYDDVISWSMNLPFIGNHISLFTILMTISTLAYTYYSNQINTSAQTGPMKYMGYIMPLMFFFILNDYSAGLNYYYFVSNIITISQQQLASLFIDKDKIRLKLEENRKKNATGDGKGKGMMARLSDSFKAQQEIAKQQQNKKK